MVNPITREDKAYLAKNEHYALLGECLAKASIKDDAGLQSCKARVNELRGIVTLSPAQAGDIAHKALSTGKLATSDLVSVYAGGRATTKVFRAVLAGKTTTA